MIRIGHAALSQWLWWIYNSKQNQTYQKLLLFCGSVFLFFFWSVCFHTRLHLAWSRAPPGVPRSDPAIASLTFLEASSLSGSRIESHVHTIKLWISPTSIRRRTASVWVRLRHNLQTLTRSNWCWALKITEADSWRHHDSSIKPASGKCFCDLML